MTRWDDERLDADPSTIQLPCPYCGRLNGFDVASLVGRGVLLPYCWDDDCEDLHAATT